jgi:hypothetical protein
MASARAMIERRRSSRVTMRIPIKILRGGVVNDCSNGSSEAVGVSRCGALLHVPFSPVLGSRIEIQNDFSKETREFRVVRISSPRPDGLFELGVEILDPARNFWGISFPDEHAWVDSHPPR